MNLGRLFDIPCDINTNPPPHHPQLPQPPAVVRTHTHTHTTHTKQKKPGLEVSRLVAGV